MERWLPILKDLARNLALWFGSLWLLCSGLAAVDLLLFLAPYRVPFFFAGLIATGAWYAIKGWLDYLSGRKKFVSCQGPGGELTQKATSYAQEQETSVDAVSPAMGDFIAGENYFAAERYPQAAQCYQESVDGVASLPALLNLATAMLNTAEFTAAEKVLGFGLQRAQRQGRDEFVAVLQANFGVLHMRMGRIEEALTSYSEALEIFQRLDDERGRAAVELNFGNVYAQQGDWDRARAKYDSTYRLHRTLGSRLGKANALAGLGNIQAQQDNLDRALHLHLDALKIHDKLANILGRANTLTNIGNVHFRSGRIGGALECYESALELHHGLGDRLGEAAALGNVGNVQFKEGRHDEALTTYRKAHNMHRRIGNVMGRANVMTNIGSVLARQKRSEEALEALEVALALYEQLGGQTRGRGVVERLMARLQSKVNGSG